MSSRFSRIADWGTRHRRAGRRGLAVLVAVSILVAIAVGLFMIAARIIPGYHDLIVKRLSARLHAPVALGEVSLSWHGWGPELDFQKLAVHSAETGDVVLSAQRLRLDFSLTAFIHGAGARPSAIELDRPHLTLVKTAKGLRVPGVKFIGGAPGAGMLGVQIRTRDGRLRLEFANPAHKPWVFAPLDFDIGGGKTHAVTLAVGLPATLGGHRLRVDGRVKTPEMNPKTWEWQGEAALDQLSIAPFDRYLPAGWPAPTGELAFDITARGTGYRLAAASGHVEVTRFAAGDGRLPRFATHFRLTSGNGFELTLNDSVFKLPKQTWQPGKVAFSRAADGRLRLQVAKVALAALPPLAEFLPPAQAKVVSRIEKMRPSGTIRGLDVAIAPGHLPSLDLTARLDDVGVYAADGAPGFNHFAGAVHMQHGVGVLALDAPGFTLRMPHLFKHTVPLDRLHGRIGIVLREDGLRLAIPDLHITGPVGLDGGMMATLTISRKSGVHTRLAAWAAPLDSNAARPLYIPTGLLPKPLAEWLMNGLHDGEAGPMRLRLVGDAGRFPFEHGGGHFSVVFGVRDVGLEPGAGWAPITGLDGTVDFENAAMHASIDSGRIEGARVLDAQAAIPDLFHPELTVKTAIAGTLPDFVAFLKKSPVGGKVSGVFGQFEVAGKARTNLTLQLPILHPARLQLAGKLELNGAKISYAKFPWPLKAINGSLSYDERGPTDADLAASILDAPIHIGLAREQGETGGHLDVNLSGRFPVATLSKVSGVDFGAYASGELPLRATVTVPLAQHTLPFTVDFSSDLDGLGIRLPVPAGKSPIAKRPFTARLHVTQDALGIEASYASVASICADLALGGQEPRLERGTLELGAGACTKPASGLAVRGGWRELDVKPWLAMLPKKKVKTPTASTANGFDLNALTGLTLDLHFGDIKALDQQFKNQDVQGVLAANEAKLTFAGPDLSGTVTIPHQPTNADPITAVLTRGHFALPQKPVQASASASVAAVQAKLASAEARANQVATANRSSGDLEPGDIPPFVFQAKQLRLGTAALDGVRIEARRVPNGIVIKPIHVGGGALEFEGQLAWLDPPASGEQGALQFVANVSSLGNLLAGLGLGPVVTGHGALSAALAWRQSRVGGKFAQGLLGKVSTDLRDGSISQVSPGAGRLLSLLSLVNVPRYLTFNFHNLTSKGFPFSRVYGDYDIENGVATTKGLHIESSIADIDITGKVDLVQGTMDQTAEVAPNYFGALPVIGAIVGGLGVGAAIFALTKLFGGSLSRALGMEYTIRGPITNPVVKKVGDKTPPQQAPAAATAGAQ